MVGEIIQLKRLPKKMNYTKIERDRERQREREDRKSVRDRQIDLQADRQAFRQSDRWAESGRHTKIYIHT